MKRILSLLVLCIPHLTAAQWERTNFTGDGGMPIILKSGPNLIVTEFSPNLCQNCPHEFIYASRDRGDSWTKVSQDLAFLALHQHEDHVFGAYYSGILRSTDHGITWMYVHPTIEARAFMSTPSYLYAGSEKFGIYRSADQGVTWQQTNSLPGLSITSLGSIDTSVFAGTSTGAIMRSDDGGFSWNSVSTGLSGGSIASIVTIGSVTFAGNDKGVFRLVKSAKTWQRCHDVAVNTLYSVGNTIFSGTLRGIFRSTNGGKSWDDASSGLPTISGLGRCIAEVFSITHDTSFLYIGDWNQGGVVWRRPLSEMITLGAVAEPRTTDVRAHPNPASSETTISFDVPAATYVSLTIYTLHGDGAAQLCGEVLQPGPHQRTWNAAAFPSGVYTYCLKIGETTTRKNIVVGH